MFWITGRIRKLTSRVEEFSTEALGTKGERIFSGDRLYQLEQRFKQLTEEVMDSHWKIKHEAEERAKRRAVREQKDRQLALLQDVTKAMKVGVLIKDSNGFRSVNELMEYFQERFGELSLFDIEKGGTKVRTITDKDEKECVFQLSSPDMLMDEQVILVNDITEQYKAEEEKEKLQRELTQSQRMESVGRLAGGVAHDFNNLLTAISGYAELARLKMREDEPIREYIDIIHNSSIRAADLTKQLLAFSRKQIIDPVVLNLNEEIDGILKLLGRLIGEHIEVAIKKSQDLWNILIDKTQIEQIVMNLALNARDAMPLGGKLILETENISVDATGARPHHNLKAGEYVRLSITDTGQGMSEEEQQYIFEPFYTTKALGKGTGLGLATVYGIVKQNRGFIYVYSETGKGTTFKIYLPRIQDAAESVKESLRYEDLPRGSEHILVVEDEYEVRKLFVRVLSKLGYAVLEAGDGQEGYDVFTQSDARIALLVTDVVMPKLSGKELAEMLHIKDPALKVIYMSGYTEHAILYNSVLEKGINFLQKPVSPKILAKAVRKALDS
jgi:signal transduction histidine kinase